MSENDRTAVGEQQDGGVALEIHVPDESIALEIGYGVLGRANQIHENPDDESEPVAEELAGIAQEIIEQYEEDAEGES